jgi:anaerobic selenocysteine-containing dehydrogenase
MSEDFRTTCSRDCPDSCGIVVTVEDGRITKHKGDPRHGVTRGFLCSRGNDYLKRFYDPNRLLYPLQRTATGWQRLSWDEALDLIATKLQYYRANFGPRSVLVVNYSGINTWIPKVMRSLFWSHFGGATFSSGGLSVEACEAAQDLDFGGDCTHEPEDLVNSRAFVVWGKNIAVTRQHWMPFVNEAKKNGAPLYVIDPVRNATAQRADRFYQIRPGSDGLLALGVARLLLERQAIDRAFIADHTVGFEAYRRLVFSHSLDEVAEATDLTVEQIGEIADLYASRKPLATMIGLGPSYWTNGGAAVRLIDALAAISGNVGVSGGGANTDKAGAPGLNLSLLEVASESETREILLPRLGEDILSATDPPIKMGWIAGANPAGTAPDTNRVREGLESLEFLVVVEQFMSATAELADLVLPCTTYLEMDDLVVAYGHNWLGLTNQVVPPQGEAKTDAEILQLLAEKLGFGEVLSGKPEEWLRRLLEPLAEAGLTLEKLCEGPVLNPMVDPIPFADHNFRTPSGKFEFVGAFSPTRLLPDGRLSLMATKTLRMVNTQILPEDLPDEPIARVHPETLTQLGLRDGEKAWLASEAGQMPVKLAADETVRRDVVLLNPALWKGELSGVNQLREAWLTDIGNGAAMHETVVTLRPF